jgi:hypothetical protein
VTAETSASRFGWRASRVWWMPRGLVARGQVAVAAALLCSAHAPTECMAEPSGLILPNRPSGAVTGTEFSWQIAALPLDEREDAVLWQIMAGNVPDFLRHFRSLQLTNSASGHTNTGTIFVAPDYLAVGSDSDYLLMPLSPNAAQRVADALGCVLPTRKLVDAIYAAAEVKLSPSPIPPSPAMTTVNVFSNHNSIVHTQRLEQLPERPLGALVAGHKKDIVVSARLNNAPGKVAIYGWHRTNGTPIQPLYLGHAAAWVDYSQCIRLVRQEMVLNGRPTNVQAILADSDLAGLLSDEGPIVLARFPTNAVSAPKVGAEARQSLAFHGAGPVKVPVWPGGFETNKWFGERIASFRFEPGVTVSLNTPPTEDFKPEKRVLLVFYALPNGNTTAQTIGKAARPGDDMHYDIQHIGAQTRWLRQVLTNYSIVVAYLENDLMSWPAWRKQHGDELIPEMLDAVKKVFAGNRLDVVLTGHSGGGSLVFGYLNSIPRIPEEVVRIAFLDSDYAYDKSAGHTEKLGEWLRFNGSNCLCVLAYHDAIALLNGKSFVSEAGGTWGRSHAMEQDLAAQFAFTSQTNGGFERHSALSGRAQFLLKGNPERKILHTVQVELNGFIHSMLSGTRLENQEYQYFGPRAYSRWIQPE